jgi:hypothetical protein
MEPIRFAERQYAHYPTLGIGRDYPPGFALFEAAFFAMFGVTAWVSRLTVVFFGICAAAGTYVFSRRMGGRRVAVLAVAALFAMPAVMEWGRQTMLELPTLAVLIGSAVAFSAYGRAPTWRRLIVWYTILTAAVFFKQTAVFGFSAGAVTLAIQAVRGRIPRRVAVVAMCLAACATALVAISLSGHGGRLLAGDATYPNRWSWDALTGYLQILPESVGWPILACAVVGLVGVLRGGSPAQIYLMSWFGTCFLMLAAADFKYNRYLFVGLFPFAVWAALGADRIARGIPSFLGRRIAVCAIVAACGWHAWSVPVPHRPDYGSIVTAHRDRLVGRAVLFSGLREGDFAFAVREHLPWRETVVVRSSKLFYACNGRPDLDFVSHVTGPEEVGPLLDRLALPCLFLERENRVGVLQEDWLRSYLARNVPYQHVASHSLSAGTVPGDKDVIIDVYEPARPIQRLVAHLDLPIPRAGRSLRVSLIPERASSPDGETAPVHP